MADSPIATPTQAQQLKDLSAIQFKNIRSRLGIEDNPFQADKTYIVFDAASGDNDLHIDSGTSKTYSISKGDGSLAVDYVDAGGTKTLNYAVAGRYLITIDGGFNGIDTSAAAQAAKDKYIGIVGGSNYPTTLANDAFESCVNLEMALFKTLLVISSYAFKNCTYLKDISFPIVTEIGDSGFENCVNLKSAIFPETTNFFYARMFYGCKSLTSVSFPKATSIGFRVFYNCYSLNFVNFPSATGFGVGGSSFESSGIRGGYFPLVDSVGESTFKNCYNLKNVDFPSVDTEIGNDAFLNCTSLERVSFPATGNGAIFAINQNAFDGCASLRVFEIEYNSGLSITATSPFTGVKLSDLYVIGDANLTEAQEVETKITGGGATKLTGYRLLY